MVTVFFKVIFVEHDWNPMKDLQAMDRAHRIGQKKVVNVYRMITRATIEEKIMSLQKFKLHTARTVISSDNAGIESMQVFFIFWSSHSPFHSSSVSRLRVCWTCSLSTLHRQLLLPILLVALGSKQFWTIYQNSGQSPITQRSMICKLSSSP